MNLHLKQRLCRSRSPTGIGISAPKSSANLLEVLNLEIKSAESCLSSNNLQVRTVKPKQEVI